MAWTDYRITQYVYDHRDNPNATARSHTSATCGVSWVRSLKAVHEPLRPLPERPY